MKKTTFLFALLSILPFVLLADHRVDSLLQVVTTSSGEEKATICLELINALKFSDQKLAKKYGLDGLEIAKQNSLKKLEPRFLLSLGVVNAIQGNNDKAILYYEDAARLFKKLENVRGIGQSHNNIAMAHERLGNYSKAMKAYEKSLVIHQTLEDSNSVVLIKGNIGNLDYRKGNYDGALKVYKELLAHAFNINSKSLTAKYYGNIGRALSRKGDFAEALRYYYMALPIMDSLDNKPAVQNLYNNIGLLFSNLEMNDLAIENYEKGIMLFDSSGNKQRLAMIYSNLSKSHISKEEYDKAYIYIQKALKIYNTKGVKSKGNLLQNLAIIHLERANYDSTEILLNKVISIGKELEQENILADAYAKFGYLYLRKKEILTAKDYLLKAEIIYHRIGDLKGLNSVVETLAKVYESLGERETAWSYKDRHAVLKDSLFGLEKMDQILRLEIEQKRSAFLQLKSEMKQTSATTPKAYLWGFLLLIGGMVATFLLFILKRQKREQVLTETINQVAEENESIKESLNQKNLELTFMSLDMVQKDGFLKKLKTELEKIAEKAPENKEVRQLIKSVHFQDLGKKDWESFKQIYQTVFPLFFDKILLDYPTLSSKELRHCALIRLKIPPLEVSEIFGISVKSVHKARHRLRAKFDIARIEKLESFILKY